MNYRERIRGVREDRDLTQAQLGKVLNKSQQGYSHIESGRAELKIDDLILLCKFYDLSADYLIGLSDFPCNGSQEICQFQEMIIAASGNIKIQLKGKYEEEEK